MGGPARWLAEAGSEADVAEALELAAARRAPVFVLGGGSNLLVADRGLDAFVLCVRARGVEIERAGDRVLVRAGAGHSWDALVARAVAEGWAGLECLSGIPGDVGATPIQNVGAYGQEVAESVVEVRAMEVATGAARSFDAAGCGFGYRNSLFKREARGRYVITAVTFALRPGAPATIRYPELGRALGDPREGAPNSLRAAREAVIALRRGKSMVLDPDDENRRSAGSFFMNPTLDASAFEAARARIEAAGVLAAGASFPHYPAEGGRVKLSAAWLIERAGFTKGYGDGPAGISTRHALALVNRGGATAADIVALARRVRAGVLDRFGVTLTPEPDLVGFAPEEIAELRRIG